MKIQKTPEIVNSASFIDLDKTCACLGAVGAIVGPTEGSNMCSRSSQVISTVDRMRSELGQTLLA